MKAFRKTFLLSLLLITVKSDIHDVVKNARNFTGKVVLVTGSSSGLGEATVKLFSSLGASVVVTGRNQTNIKRVAEEAQKLSPHGLKPLEVVADLTKDDNRVHLINETINKFGGLDVLVNNAGAGSFTFINDSDILSKFDNAIKVDVSASLHLTHLSLPYLQHSKGTVINIASLSVHKPFIGGLTYAIAKSSLAMMTKVLAVELGSHGIRVNTIIPGFIETGTLVGFGFPEQQLERVISVIPLQSMGKPIDIANGIVLLASSDAQYITGTELIIDGGFQYNFVSNIFE